jgi:hypothetical protein
MLKRLIVNQKTVPVPVPVKTLADACSWVDEILVPVGETVTSATLDGKDVLDLWSSPKVSSAISLHPDSRLELRVESPEDLALQSLDSMHALSGAILRGIKGLAVHLWQARQNESQHDLLAVRDDIELIGELLDRLEEMGVSDKVDLSVMRELKARIRNIACKLTTAISFSDWRACAQILLRDTATTTGLETLLRHLMDESEACHLRLLTSRSLNQFGTKIESL